MITVKLSRRSREASVSAAVASGSSNSPSPYTPHTRRSHRHQPAVLEIAHEPGLVDRVDHAEPHGSGRELPEVGHQPGMGVGREPAAANLLSIAREVFLPEATLEKGAGVDAGRRMRLEIHQISAEALVRAAKEVIEAGLEDFRGRRIARNVASELAIGAVGAQHHGERVPANDRGNAFLEREIAGIGALRPAPPRAAAQGACPHRNGGSSKLRNFRECSVSSMLCRSPIAAMPICRCSPIARS